MLLFLFFAFIAISAKAQQGGITMKFNSEALPTALQRLEKVSG